MIQFNKYANTPIRLTKIEDTRFNGKHPNEINIGYVKEGVIDLEMSNKHQCFFMIEGGYYFHTSQVTEIKESVGFDLAYTLNSVYRVEPRINAIPGVQEKHSVDVVETN